ncbi:molybdopterin-dependent oxidoreductase [Streptosporangium roseum]|uniref:molybdopterin-dependent oxidoreductase n=1 Tax=Streptosporangium roseum TaxID=2001 RepID=UPI003D9E2EAF
MVRKASRDDAGDEGMRVVPPKDWAGGLPAVAHAMETAYRQMGVGRAALILLQVNRKRGFDCPGCAWPEGEHRSPAEFCENGAKAVAEEATTRRVGREFFAARPVGELAVRSDHWLGQQGRLTEPMRKPAGSDHYVSITWEAAFEVIARKLRALGGPDETLFYSSGRTSNEAAFVYQLLVRRFGTNNLPDCSTMCQESSGSAPGTGGATPGHKSAHPAAPPGRARHQLARGRSRRYGSGTRCTCCAPPTCPCNPSPPASDTATSVPSAGPCNGGRSARPTSSAPS